MTTVIYREALESLLRPISKLRLARRCCAFIVVSGDVLKAAVDPIPSSPSTVVAIRTATTSWTVSASDLVPVPHLNVRPTTAAGKGRRSVPAAVLTSSPYKKLLRDSKVGKKCTAKRTINLKKGDLQPPSKRAKQAPMKKATNRGDIKNPKKRTVIKTVDMKPRNQRKEKQQASHGGSVAITVSPSESDCTCLTCGELYSDSRVGEKWIMCQDCKEWAHEQCVDLSHADIFLCDSCKDKHKAKKGV